VGRIFGLLGVSKDEPSQAVGLVQAGVHERLERGCSRRIRWCRDGPDFLRQPDPRFRSCALHPYRRTTSRLHSIYAGDTSPLREIGDRWPQRL
jgi:hypothetical protein